MATALATASASHGARETDVAAEDTQMASAAVPVTVKEALQVRDDDDDDEDDDDEDDEGERRAHCALFGSREEIGDLGRRARDDGRTTTTRRERRGGRVYVY